MIVLQLLNTVLPMSGNSLKERFIFDQGETLNLKVFWLGTGRHEALEVLLGAQVFTRLPPAQQSPPGGVMMHPCKPRSIVITIMSLSPGNRVIVEISRHWCILRMSKVVIGVYCIHTSFTSFIIFPHRGFSKKRRSDPDAYAQGRH